MVEDLKSIGTELALSTSACIGNSELLQRRIIQMIHRDLLLCSGVGIFFAGRANGSLLRFFAVWIFDIVNSLSTLFWLQRVVNNVK
jgi:hypothetical protein